MSATAKSIVATATAEDNKTAEVAKGIKSLKTMAGSHSPQAEAQRRKWGVETHVVRSIHARKF
jgi:hypothetical protein